MKTLFVIMHDTGGMTCSSIPVSEKGRLSTLFQVEDKDYEKAFSPKYVVKVSENQLVFEEIPAVEQPKSELELLKEKVTELENLIKK